MDGRVDDTCAARPEEMSKQLWMLRMSGDQAWAECQITNQRVRLGGCLCSCIDYTKRFLVRNINYAERVSELESKFN